MRRFVQALSAATGFPPALPVNVLEQLRQLPDRYNISIHQPAGVLFLQERQWRIAEMAWGLIPSWEPEPHTRYSTQTARLDRAPSSRMYRRAWATRRCVIPLNGYYKWDREATPRQPYFIQSAAGDVLFVAGLWSRWGDGVAIELLSFSVLTQPNPAIPAPLVPDGPVFVEGERIADWINAEPGDAGRILKRMRQPRLEAYAVSRRVANRKLDDYSLLEPISAREDFETAFDPDELDEDE